MSETCYKSENVVALFTSSATSVGNISKSEKN